MSICFRETIQNMKAQNLPFFFFYNSQAKRETYFVLKVDEDMITIIEDPSWSPGTYFHFLSGIEHFWKEPGVEPGYLCPFSQRQ